MVITVYNPLVIDITHTTALSNPATNSKLRQLTALITRARRAFVMVNLQKSNRFLKQNSVMPHPTPQSTVGLKILFFIHLVQWLTKS